MLSNSTRSIPKATYVSLLPDQSLSSELGKAVLKFGFVKQLNLQKGEVNEVVKQSSSLQSHSKATHHKTSADAQLMPLLRRVEAAKIPSDFPSPTEFADVPSSQFVAFGKALTSLRHAKVANTRTEAEKTVGTSGTGGAQVESLLATSTNLQETGRLMAMANSAAAAVGTFSMNIATAPIGMMNLERLEMTPAGIEQGELIATVPLAPMEKTSVVQQEWSVVSQEFTSIVTDELENYSEKGVTENSELAQATTSQNAHSNQFNITASASGGCGFVSGSVSTGFSSQDQNSQSATDSRKHAVATTQKASSRVKQSRKVTISSSTISGSSETTSRVLENPSTTQPMRVDYFSMMRKWHVGLYRYGLRLTYDITVPEPGAALRAAYQQIDLLTKDAEKAFSFDLDPTTITAGTYPSLAGQYGVSLPAAPKKATDVQIIGGPIEHLGTEGSSILGTNILTFTVRDGYEIASIDLDLELGNMTAKRRFDVLGSVDDTWLQPSNIPQIDNNQRHHFSSLGFKAPGDGLFMSGASGDQSISYVVGNTNVGIAQFQLNLQLTQEYKDSWVQGIWNSLYSAAQTAYYTNQAKIQAQISALQDKINNADTLTLRREENEEIMKCALRWLLGPGFEFMPDEVISFIAAGQDANAMNYGVNFTGNQIGLNDREWSIFNRYESIVNFINEAIEWENVIYFLYSYFWDIPSAWSFIRQLEHTDTTRQAFLRAGAARVVLTVRKGYETAWTWFVDRYALDTPGGPWPNYPYMTIAQQIRDYDNTNYPGIPAANSNSSSTGGVDDGNSPAGTTSSADVSPGASNTTPVSIKVEDSTGFKVGAIAIIDNWDSGIQESQMITAVPDKNHIMVAGLLNEHPKTTDPSKPFPIIQAQEKGVLIAEWFEYTPSKGTFIAINSTLSAIQ